MQPTFAAFNFTSSSNDQDGPLPSKLKENKDACRFPTSMEHPPPPPPKKKKREVLPSSWLSQFDLLGFDEKRGTMHLMFILMKLMIKNWCLKFLYPHFTFCTPNFTCQGVQKPLVKNFSGDTELC